MSVQCSQHADARHHGRGHQARRRGVGLLQRPAAASEPHERPEQPWPFCLVVAGTGDVVTVIGERGDGFPINLSASTDFDLCIDESYIGRVDLLVAVT